MVQVLSDNPEELSAVLAHLSVVERRTAGYLLSEEILPTIESERYWRFFTAIVPQNSKAYLGTFLKAAVRLLKKGELVLDEAVLESFASIATPIDVRKFLETVLPCVNDGDDMLMLVRIFCANRLEQASPYLLKAGTPMAYYVLFNLLKTVEADTETLKFHALQLIKKGDHLSFNFASILRQYFDLKHIPGFFSLKIEPYEFGRLDQGPDQFIKLLKG